MGARDGTRGRRGPARQGSALPDGRLLERFAHVYQHIGRLPCAPVADEDRGVAAAVLGLAAGLRARRAAASARRGARARAEETSRARAPRGLPTMASVQTGHAAAGSMTQRRFGLPDDEPVPMKMISDMRLPSAARRSSAAGPPAAMSPDMRAGAAWRPDDAARRQTTPRAARLHAAATTPALLARACQHTGAPAGANAEAPGNSRRGRTTRGAAALCRTREAACRARSRARRMHRSTSRVRAGGAGVAGGGHAMAARNVQINKAIGAAQSAVEVRPPARAHAYASAHARTLARTRRTPDAR